jgi:shikimate kinase
MCSKPKLVIITGLPGAGKTTLAKKLAEILYFPTVIRDELKEGYVNTFGVKHDILPKDTNRIVSDFFFETIESFISIKISLIAECAFSHNIFESKIRHWKSMAHIIFVNCHVEPETAALRHLRRGLDNSRREFFHGDARVSHFRKTGENIPCSNYIYPHFDVLTFKVSTENGYSPSLHYIAAKVKVEETDDMNAAKRVNM